MPYRVIDSNSSTDDWSSVFVQRAEPHAAREWTWCAGSLQRNLSTHSSCPSCGQQIPATWRLRDERNLHLSRPIRAGVYIIDVGRTEFTGETRCLKIGCSRDILRRLREHLKKSAFEKCVVYHCLPCPGDYQIGEAIECLLSHTLEQHGFKPLQSGNARSYDYYIWSDHLLRMCQHILVPELVADVLSAFERRALAPKET